MKRMTQIALIAIIGMGAATAAQAGSLENLERERADVIATMLDPGVNAQDRQQKLSRARHRLVDLERMVLRDNDLKGKNTPVVRIAFRNYDLTFLAHASVEKNLTLQDQWLDQIGVSTASLMDARVGRR
ncbi:hypothetical protein [Aestuariispira ectoiniformans]|uniref:hypothetical protein n=1 Tax=Aestuariispira ectoiniformans TaxID=2775080 RepID=UPI00223B9E33|nr:hypothetical protein [Aestuariispira ectoiniformans]